MKIKAILILALIVLTSFQQKDKADQKLKKNLAANELSLKGTWELISRYNYRNNEVVDTFYVAKSYRQVKMYSDSKVMWSRKLLSNDSTEWFGYGSYKLNANKDTLREVLDFASHVMNKYIEELGVFVMEISELTENSFTQIEIDGEGNRVISENYVRIE